MKAFELTKEAKNDLRKMARFTEKRWGRDQRFLYIKQFDDAFHLLAREASKSKIIIIRVLHKNMDVESKFLHT